MAKSNADRSAKAAAQKKSRGEEEIRLHCLPGTRQALAELMTGAVSRNRVRRSR
jgi:hypothetical protein